MKKFNDKESRVSGPKKRYSAAGGSSKPRRSSYGNENSFSASGPRRSSSDVKTYEATCETCKKTCGVPFKPNGKKPVYCSLCFKKDKQGESRMAYGKSDYQKSSPRSESYKQDFEELNKKLDAIIQMLAKR
ncbi:MAG: hypothetical protein COW24_04525 [Candidatus Kerfeldbacteria bacterium CG15_BIG_FIL_POST_REV_8_21_14_020_45_12]|uniref:CxxC-x17-CxxC domain-containing protein n=1 Tax=Candidatus Kerfeldbacteria bacterium CG15_BIG_FIL_POST_REV_8_21_14_020_45_12 TaxID=2014247 RepID=A0A2M7H2Y3_9BACT|nr:MAG: hypothetical protein COW24_04525 [Candidatus Kerfeldbacteria bacterium CG15_BIG_FIL_POST_REV_8_21_14_020_45_12]PJA93357.1 MAG: hypothetical protein CO132_03300 [Candidatus Kerfeldbacteria bacterium CG_4_9_14_3_um_filter_45_8]